ncbi:hypothetical protein P153DRAFT_358593 [Dothidotthia symphoricarpi CBS 119687]|uniref:Uncharacterized protein n=1 Tax=Dothidotthia symphoricarpi CBS 119687 TaxID=1392245 RepID=A0A6A6A6V9_9PLEO|nr:uncharacterized protein P153DRAFT_358593 [Dothidotthia symphoricarpi CBS 119687]KAF2127752.1 hypothetical protein P153DRAFT_358593 [Dothidotthia symphoricarpi CBS 119687]
MVIWNPTFDKVDYSTTCIVTLLNLNHILSTFYGMPALPSHTLLNRANTIHPSPSSSVPDSKHKGTKIAASTIGVIVFLRYKSEEVEKKKRLADQEDSTKLQPQLQPRLPPIKEHSTNSLENVIRIVKYDSQNTLVPSQDPSLKSRKTDQSDQSSGDVRTLPELAAQSAPRTFLTCGPNEGIPMQDLRNSQQKLDANGSVTSIKATSPMQSTVSPAEIDNALHAYVEDKVKHDLTFVIGDGDEDEDESFRLLNSIGAVNPFLYTFSYRANNISLPGIQVWYFVSASD